jgi:hypothetical protein
MTRERICWKRAGRSTGGFDDGQAEMKSAADRSAASFIKAEVSRSSLRT